MYFEQRFHITSISLFVIDLLVTLLAGLFSEIYAAVYCRMNFEGAIPCRTLDVLPLDHIVDSSRLRGKLFYVSLLGVTDRDTRAVAKLFFDGLLYIHVRSFVI